MKQSHEIKPAAAAIEAIEQLSTEEELAGFVTHEETRKTVLKAADEKYAELTAPKAAPEEVDLEEPAPQVEQETEETPEPKAGEDEVVSVDAELVEELKSAVANKVAEEKKRYINGVIPEGDVTAKLATNAEAITGESEVAAATFDAFLEALANQVTADRNKRGLSQAPAVDLALEELLETLTAE